MPLNLFTPMLQMEIIIAQAYVICQIQVGRIVKVYFNKNIQNVSNSVSPQAFHALCAFSHLHTIF